MPRGALFPIPEAGGVSEGSLGWVPTGAWLFAHSPVARAIHGLQREHLVFHAEGKHVLAVVLPVPRDLPELRVENVGGDHFRKATLQVFALETKWVCLSNATRVCGNDKRHSDFNDTRRTQPGSPFLLIYLKSALVQNDASTYAELALQKPRRRALSAFPLFPPSPSRANCSEREGSLCEEPALTFPCTKTQPNQIIHWLHLPKPSHQSNRAPLPPCSEDTAAAFLQKWETDRTHRPSPRLFHPPGRAVFRDPYVP